MYPGFWLYNLNNNILNNEHLIKIKPQLDKFADKYNTLEFIPSDPIQVPHRFSRKEDIEISAFLTATIAWGQRKSIINNANRLMQMMDNAPYEFITEGSEDSDWLPVRQFVHRTFNGEDCLFFLRSLKNIYQNHGGLEAAFCNAYNDSQTIYGALSEFYKIFFSIPYLERTTKHISNVAKNSSAKRLNMFLRWMVRCDDNDVDFGLWKNIPASALMLPLDVHTGNVARALGLLSRQQNDWKAVEEITSVLRMFDSVDPIKYDFALFGIGAFRDKEYQYPKKSYTGVIITQSSTE